MPRDSPPEKDDLIGRALVGMEGLGLTWGGSGAAMGCEGRGVLSGLSGLSPGL